MGRRRSLVQVSGSFRVVRRLISAGAVAALWCCTTAYGSNEQPLASKGTTVLSDSVADQGIDSYTYRSQTASCHMLYGPLPRSAHQSASAPSRARTSAMVAPGAARAIVHLATHSSVSSWKVST
jgi:hypothetical protein